MTNLDTRHDESDPRIAPELGGTTNEQDVFFGVLVIILLLGGVFLLARCSGNDPTSTITGIITGQDDDSNDDLDQGAGEPDVGSVAGDRTPEVAGNSTVVSAGGAVANPVMELTGDGIRLSGTVGSKETRDQIVTEAAAVFGAERVEDDLVVEESVSDEGGVLTVTGPVASATASDAAASLGANATRNTPLTVDNQTSVGTDVAAPDSTDAETTTSADDSSATASSSTTDAETTTSGTETSQAGSSTSDTQTQTIEKPEQADTTTSETTTSETTTTAAPATTASTINPSEIASRLTDLTRQSDVLFDYNSANLSGAAVGTLDQVVAILADAPQVRVEIGGHTDAVGPASRNLRLSQERADSVRRYLIDHGIAPDRLVATGYGESAPVALSETEEGRIANRRIEFTVIG